MKVENESLKPDEDPMKITVFGGAGFLGSHVCEKLSNAGHDVFIYDIVPSPWLRSDQSMIVGDILDEKAVLKLGFLSLYIYLGVKINILSVENLALVRSLIRPKEAKNLEKN